LSRGSNRAATRPQDRRRGLRGHCQTTAQASEHSRGVGRRRRLRHGLWRSMPPRQRPGRPAHTWIQVVEDYEKSHPSGRWRWWPAASRHGCCMSGRQRAHALAIRCLMCLRANTFAGIMMNKTRPSKKARKGRHEPLGVQVRGPLLFLWTRETRIAFGRNARGNRLVMHPGCGHVLSYAPPEADFRVNICTSARRARARREGTPEEEQAHAGAQDEERRC
jgi:hypothetical protein